MPKPTKRQKAGLLSKSEIALRKRAQAAYHEAYHEQERRTVDSTVKRTVAAALQHMYYRVIDEPFTPAPPTLYDAQTMAEQIQLDFVRQVRAKLEARKTHFELFIEVARKSGREPTELLSDTMVMVADVLETVLAMPMLDVKGVLPTIEEPKKGARP